MVIAGHSSRPIAVSLGRRDAEGAVAGEAHHRRVGAGDLGADHRRQPVAAGAEQAGRQVFAAGLEARIGVADGAVVADVGRDDRLARQRGLDGAPCHARAHPVRLSGARALVPRRTGIVVLMVHGAQLLRPGRLGARDGGFAAPRDPHRPRHRTGAQGSPTPPCRRRRRCRPCTGLVRPMRFGLTSTWMIAAFFGQ